MLKKLVLFFLLSVQLHASHAQGNRTHWIDSVFNALTRQEKVAQLFMMPTSAYASAEEIDELTDLVKDNGIGGLYITRGGPVGHARLVNKLQKISPRKLLVGISAEWGLAQMMDSIIGFQKPMVAAAWKEDSLTSVWARAIARQMKLMGFHVNFAPNADEEIFPNDYLRYFGNEETLVGRRTTAFVSALQSTGIMAVAKHLPTARRPEQGMSDSLLVLQLRRVDTTSLRPFQELIAGNVGGIATSYLHFSMQGQGDVPAAVSQVFISEILKKRLKFNGLVFTDIREVTWKAGKIRKGEAELLAFQTGADVLMNSTNAPASIKKIGKEVRKNKVLEEQLDVSIKKILAAKYDAGLHRYQPINTDNLYRKLHDPEFYLDKARLAAAAVTIVQNSDSLIPFRTLEDVSFVCLSIGKDVGNEFDHYLKKYASFKSFSVKSVSDTALVHLSPSDVVVAGIFPQAAPLEGSLQTWINRIAVAHKLVITHFGNPSSLEAYANAAALLAAYTDQDQMPAVSAQAIFGAIPAMGMLPVAVGSWRAGESKPTRDLDRLSYSVPEAAGLNSRTLEKIRTIMEEAIASGATPGCHTLIAKDGKVVYEVSAGWQTYEKQFPVNDETIYDLASVTKISATLQSVMFMQEHGLIDINRKASVYLPELKNSNKADFTIKDILTHQAGLWPFLPFWAQTMKDNAPMAEFYQAQQSEDYPFPVSENLFANRVMKDSLWQWIVKARIRDKPPRTPYDYRYSDMGFYILQHLSEKLLNQPMEDFLEQNLYAPMGSYTTGYLPLRRFPAVRIAPTERDTLFRKSLLTGYVHDQGAAMHGGIAGHAGLFSTANDLAKLGQLWLQKGRYGGYQYYKPETIELFSSRQFSDSRRGLGWDKPMPSDWSGPTSRHASAKTFGHTGFTGTCIWVDPEFNLVFVFLSNRVQPDMNNNKLLTNNIRPRIQQVIYEAIFDYCATKN